MLLKYPRFIHAEFMTHRAFSRNAASSRAIPFEKQLSAMYRDPAVPLVWGSNQKGMQAGAELEHEETLKAEREWLDAMEEAARYAGRLWERGCHKQIVNRVIEPFTHIVVLVSATEWANFLELRDHEAAEPHMRLLAQAIRHELETAPIQRLEPGEWHLPFTGTKEASPAAIAHSVACAASTSYKTVEGFDMSPEAAKRLHDQFVNSRPQHASPLEHVARVDGNVMDNDHWQFPRDHGNFVGFRQYRRMIQS
jgi:hypothetical protein